MYNRGGIGHLRIASRKVVSMISCMPKAWRNRAILLISVLVVSLIIWHSLRGDKNLSNAQDWLAACPVHVVRTIWFVDDNPMIQTVQEIDLAKQSGWCGTYYAGGGASWKGTQSRDFKPDEFQEVEHLVQALPSPNGISAFEESVSVAVNSNGTVQLWSYPRKSAPPEIQRLISMVSH